MSRCWLLICFLLLPLACVGQVVDEDVLDVEGYLDSLVGVGVVKVDSTKVVEVTENKGVTNDSLGLKVLIGEGELDSLRVVAEAERGVNPLFMDWVFMEDGDLKVDADGVDSLRWEVRKVLEGECPEVFRWHDGELPDAGDLGLRTPTNRRLDEFLLKQEMRQLPGVVDIKSVKRNWVWNGKVSVQMSQSYISKNWYTGGYSNLALLSYAVCNVNYSNQRNFTWDNRFEWKAGFNSTTSDSLRWLQTNEDLLRVTSKLGLKASTSWSYSLSGELNSTLFNTFVQNSRERSTAPLSPIQFYLSLGMEYKYKKMLTVSLMPFSYKLTYCLDTERPDGAKSVADKFNIPDGEHLLHKVGSRVQVDFAYAFSKELKLESKLYVYTDYKDVEFDWEVTGNFIATSFLTIQCSLHPRYDSSLVLSEGQKSRFQFREFVSLGFLYAF